MRSMYAGISSAPSITPNIKLPPLLWPVSMTLASSSVPNSFRHLSTSCAILAFASGCALAKRRPTQSRAFRAHEHNSFVRHQCPQQPNLCGHVLDVVMPIEPWLHLAAERLLDCVAGGQSHRQSSRVARAGFPLSSSGALTWIRTFRIDRFREACFVETASSAPRARRFICLQAAGIGTAEKQ